MKCNMKNSVDISLLIIDKSWYLCGTARLCLKRVKLMKDTNKYHNMHILQVLNLLRKKRVFNVIQVIRDNV